MYSKYEQASLIEYDSQHADETLRDKLQSCLYQTRLPERASLSVHGRLNGDIQAVFTATYGTAEHISR